MLKSVSIGVVVAIALLGMCVVMWSIDIIVIIGVSATADIIVTITAPDVIAAVSC